MTEYKILKSKTMEELEELVNEYFFLMDYYNQKLEFFKLERIGSGFERRFIAHIVYSGKYMSQLALVINSYNRENDKQKDNPKFQKIKKLIDKFDIKNIKKEEDQNGNNSNKSK